ncbi:MAG: hypothetical protein H6835_00710 [Planctomycetes bacterium]|nr:hypothetical protein [Planctomycetota bacterium]
MTRYDPFSYGSVRLDPGAPEEPRGQDAEEMLFAPGESVKQAPPADDSWSLMEEDVGSLLPGNGSPFADASDFGAEILGEASDAETAFSMPEPARRPEVGARPPVDDAPAAEQAPRSTTSGRREVRRRELPSVRPAAAKAAEAAQRQAVPKRRRSALLSVVAPLALFAGGGSAAAWFWTMQHNPVMAGILGATTLVGALFAWLLLRP